MKKLIFSGAFLMCVPVVGMSAQQNVLMVETDAYRWQGDTVYQNEFKAWAESPTHIRSTYKGRPGYFMPVEQEWKVKNDLSAYPQLKTDNMLHAAIYNMGLDEMINNVEPDTTLRTGKEWAGVWTRDVSYSIILSMAALQPEASMISLMKKVNQSGQIIQDTGSGGAWPISTDRMVWVLAAWELYKVTGSKAWLDKVYPIAVRSLAKDEKTVMSMDSLVKGETSFIDWREQSYPKWMQTADISQSEAFGTNVMYAAVLKAVGEMAHTLGKKKEADIYFGKARKLAENIDEKFFMPDKGYYGMYTYGYDHKIVNPRAEMLGHALSILFDVVPADKQESVSEHFPYTPYGPPIFYPQIADMPSYHNNALWPFVASYMTLAQAKAGNEKGVMDGIGSVFRPAALFATNKENLNLDNGDYFTELNSSNMLWSLAGNLGITQQILFGIHFDKDGLVIKPFVPEVFAGDRTLSNFPYRGARLNIEVKGYGSKVASLIVNGKKMNPNTVIPAKILAKGANIIVEMDNQPIRQMALNRVPNLKAPLTPITRKAGNKMVWNPIEYIGEYLVLKDGREVGRTHSTSWDISEPAEWQVIGVSGDGIQSFASQPIDNRPVQKIRFANSKTSLDSKETSYQPAFPITGYDGGFIEIDKGSAPVVTEIEVPEDGEYILSVRYANGNGPVNTENKAAIRSLTVDDRDAGTLVMPTRGVGNWSDWGMSNGIVVPLRKGTHQVMIEYQPEDENMNIKTNHALLEYLEIIKR